MSYRRAGGGLVGRHDDGDVGGSNGGGSPPSVIGRTGWIAPASSEPLGEPGRGDRSAGGDVVEGLPAGRGEAEQPQRRPTEHGRLVVGGRAPTILVDASS